MDIPQRLVDAIIFFRGSEDGARWLAELPRRVMTHARVWNLRPLAVAEGGAMSCCVFCETADGAQVVLKVPLDAASGRREARALSVWSEGGASPRVLRQSSKTGVFLMERVVPGETARLSSGPEDTAHLLALLQRMHAGKEAGVRFADVSEVGGMRLDWAEERFQDSRYAADRTPVENARRVLAELCSTTTMFAVLHGDLQQKNLLAGAADDWFAIDPLPCIGDINSDPALWAVMQDVETPVEQRVEELGSHLTLDVERLRRWAYVFAVAELRPYLPRAAARMKKYIDEYDGEPSKR